MSRPTFPATSTVWVSQAARSKRANRRSWQDDQAGAEEQPGANEGQQVGHGDIMPGLLAVLAGRGEVGQAKGAAKTQTSAGRQGSCPVLGLTFKGPRFAVIFSPLLQSTVWSPNRPAAGGCA